MKNKVITVILISVVVLSGCQTSIYTLTNEEKSYPATDLEKINVTTHEKIDGDYNEVGYIHAWGNSVDDSIDNLKEQAAKFGGTDVIQLQTSIVRSYIYILFIPIPIDDYFCQGIVITRNIN